MAMYCSRRSLVFSLSRAAGRPRFLSLSISAMVAAMAVVQGAAAQSATSDDADHAAVQGSNPVHAKLLSGVQVSAKAVSLVPGKTRSGTKTDVDLKEVPQAISVITAAQIEAQGAQNVPQALRYTAGVLSAQRGFSEDGGGLENIYSRGFLVDQYLDGLRLPSPSIASYSVASIDPYGLEQIDLIHGPASVLYGQSSPGGLLNLVSKTPTDAPLHEVGVQFGSYARKQLQGDVSDALNASGTWRYRLVAVAQDGKTQVDHVKTKHLYVAPSLRWQPDDNTQLILLGGYSRSPDAGYYNTLPKAGTSSPLAWGSLSPHLDVGDPDFDQHSLTQAWLGYQFTHAFANGWSFSSNARVTRADGLIQGIFANGYSDGTGADPTLSRYALRNLEDTTTYTLDNRLRRQFVTGDLKHDVVLGVDGQKVDYHTAYGYNFAEPSLDVLAPIYGTGLAPTTPSANMNDNLSQVGVYAQDLMALGQWRFLISGREDDAYTREQSLPVAAGGTYSAHSQTDHAFTTHVGVNYLFDNGLAPYVSYTTSFQPQVGQLSDYNAASNTWALGNRWASPSDGKQYEVGLKYQPANQASFVSLSLYDLTQTNVLSTNSTNNEITETGKVRSRGVELEGNLSLTPGLSLLGNLTYLDQVTTSDVATEYVGKRIIAMPRQQAALWLQYRLSEGGLDGLALRLGARAVGSSYADQANTEKNAGYTVFDGGIAYPRGNWNYSLNIANLTDRHYIASCAYSLLACNYGALRMVTLGASYRW